MVLTKERKVLLGLLGSAGLILVVDQLLLAPPQSARAQQGQPTPATAAPVTSEAPQPVVTQRPSEDTDDSIFLWNDRLTNALNATQSAGVDPFSAQAKSGSEGAAAVSPTEFVQAHKLTGVLIGGERGVAMVNGRAVGMGEEVAGYRLIRVDSRSADFVFGEQVVRLELPLQSPAR